MGTKGVWNEQIAKAVLGMEATAQSDIDRKMIDPHAYRGLFDRFSWEKP